MALYLGPACSVRGSKPHHYFRVPGLHIEFLLSTNELTGTKDSSVQVALSYFPAKLRHPSPNHQLNQVFAVASYPCK